MRPLSLQTYPWLTLQVMQVIARHFERDLRLAAVRQPSFAKISLQALEQLVSCRQVRLAAAAILTRPHPCLRSQGVVIYKEAAPGLAHLVLKCTKLLRALCSQQ